MHIRSLLRIALTTLNFSIEELRWLRKAIFKDGGSGSAGRR
jgi:hypothetical protein